MVAGARCGTPQCLRGAAGTRRLHTVVEADLAAVVCGAVLRGAAGTQLALHAGACARVARAAAQGHLRRNDGLGRCVRSISAIRGALVPLVHA
eukprot:9709233-Alexandrium_andersonii.AAC.1